MSVTFRCRYVCIRLYCTWVLGSTIVESRTNRTEPLVSQRQRNPRQRTRAPGGRSTARPGADDTSAEQQLRKLTRELEERIVERTAELELLSRELEYRRAYLETLVQHIPAGLVIADAASGLVTMSNERAQKIAGLEPGHLPLPLGAPDTGPLGLGGEPVSHDPRELPLARALTGEVVRAERLALTRRDGTNVVLEVDAAPIRDASGHVIAAAAVFQDVTEGDMRSLAARDFVANAAHELRTPLAAIVSGIDVLESGAKEIPAERDRFLAHVAREADRLVRLTRALLLLARIQSGVEEPRAEVVELAPLLREIADGLRPAAGVRVTVRCPADAAAIANRGLLEQALTSLATNASRYTEAGRITLSVARPRDRVRIRVRDTGPGMAPETLMRAGERFYRGDPSSVGGFGLGLAIARQAAEAMGGVLRLSSELDVGTTAEIELPSARLVTGP